MIAGVKIRCRTDVLSLGEVPLRHRVGRISELKFFLFVPDKLTSGVDRRTCLFDNLRDTAQTVVGEFAAGGKTGVVDCNQPVRSVPFESPRAAITRDAAVEI